MFQNTTPKTLYIIRHGQTEYNKLGLVQGSGIDSSLNETGIAQAARFYELHQEVPFTKAYISALKRTQESIAPFIAAGLPFQKLAGLNEISWGEIEGKIPTSESDSRFHDILASWQQGQTHAPLLGGESPDQVSARQKEAMQVIMSEPEHETVLVCMHGRALRILMCTLFQQDLRYMDQYEHSNLCLYKLYWNGQAFEMLVRNQSLPL